MMIMPEVVNMPPTPWQTEILASGIWTGAVPHIWRIGARDRSSKEVRQSRPTECAGRAPGGASSSLTTKVNAHDFDSPVTR